MNLKDFIKTKMAGEPEVKNSPAGEKNTEVLRSAGEEGKTRVFNLIILDESGSMSSIYKAALSGMNETLDSIREAQKEHSGQEHYVTLVTFSSVRYNQLYTLTPVEMTSEVKENQYRPNGCTPLYDAMGRSINELRDQVGKDDVVLVTIITDGLENASREYDGRAIKALVEEMREEGWVFTYIGANQDVDKVAESMSINNRMAFEASDEDARVMFCKVNSSRRKFYGKLDLEEYLKKLKSGEIKLDSGDFFEG